MTTFEQIGALVRAGESETVEFKRSAAELRRAGETLCAFLNGNDSRVLIGVTPTGKAPSRVRVLHRGRVARD